jgi:predicted GIY-YIG superfamily endonuclease
MDLYRPEVTADSLRNLVSLLPAEKTSAVYVVKLGNGSLYIGHTTHLAYRLDQIARATAGEKSTASAAIARYGGAFRLETFVLTRTEADAKALAEKWIERARQRGQRISTDELVNANRNEVEAQAGRDAFGITAPLDF